MAPLNSVKTIFSSGFRSLGIDSIFFDLAFYISLPQSCIARACDQGQSLKDRLGGVLIPFVHAINQPFLLHVHVRRDQCCSSHRGIFGREADLASQEQLHRDAIPWGIDSSVLMLSEL